MPTDKEICKRYGAKFLTHMGEKFVQMSDGQGYTCDERMLLDLMDLAREDEREQNKRHVKCPTHGEICVPDLRGDGLHLFFCPQCAIDEAFEKGKAEGQKLKGIIQLEQIGKKVADDLKPYQSGYNAGIQEERKRIDAIMQKLKENMELAGYSETERIDNKPEYRQGQFSIYEWIKREVK